MVELNSKKEIVFPDLLAGRYCQSFNTLSPGLTVPHILSGKVLA